jgi:hypothetical protein
MKNEMKRILIATSALVLLLLCVGSTIAIAEETDSSTDAESDPPLQGEPSPDVGGSEGSESPPDWTNESKSDENTDPVQEQDMIQNQTMDGNETKNQYEYNYSYEGEGKFTWRNRYRYEIQSGIENETVVKECNISKKSGKMYIHSYEYQNGMDVEIKQQNQHKLEVKVSAEFKEGKVLVLNIDENAFKIKNSQKLVVKFDGQEISEDDIDDVVSAEGTQAKYAKAVGEDGGQFVVYIPHFSEHVITFEVLDAGSTSSISLISLAIGAAFITLVILVIIAVRTRKNRDE